MALRKSGRMPLTAAHIAVGCSVLAMAACVLGVAGHSSEGLWDVAWSLGSVAALAGAIPAYRRAPRTQRARWRLWVLAAAAWLGGQLFWNAFDLFGAAGSPNGADLGWWLFALLGGIGMVQAPSSLGRLREVVAAESLPLICAASTLSVAVIWGDVTQSHLSPAAEASALAYRVLFVGLVVLALQGAISGRLGRLRDPGAMLVFGGFLLQSVAFIAWSAILLERRSLVTHTVLDSVWVVGLCAIGLGGIVTSRRGRVDVAAEEPSYRGGLLPGGLFLLTLAEIVRARTTTEPVAVTILLDGGLLCCGGVLILRGAMLSRRLRGMLALERKMREGLARRESQLASLNERLLEDSRRDALTGMRNRRALAEDMAVMAEVRSSGGTLALALCDVDHFKDYNDRVGHLGGDQALRALASTVRGALRSEDTAYRFGGEELLLVLRTGAPGEALRACERIRAAVEQSGYPHPGGIGGVLTVSIGVAAGPDAPEVLLARADAALYEAKRGGRNRTLLATADSGMEAPQRRREVPRTDEPVPRHVRRLLAVSRAAAAGQGELPVVEALADTIRAEFSFGVVAVNLREELSDELRVALVVGDQEARAALMDTTSTLSQWERMLTPQHERCGAYWLPAGDYEWEGPRSWVPQVAPAPQADAWQPDDMLLLPLHSSGGELIGVVSVDQPLLGRRPEDEEITLLMAVVDHAALALEQARRDSAATGEQTQELRLAAVMLLAETLDLRDAGTARHSRMVGRFAREIAEELRLEAARVQRVHAAGVLHDLGKLGIADKILHKPGPLDGSEWREMQRHPEIGARILEHAGLHDIAGWVRAHHERMDGEGYPRGLPLEQVPLESRILAVADAYEAMIADRPYRAGMNVEQAQAELLRCAGTQFDPVVVEAFLRVQGAAPVPPSAVPV